MECVFTDRNTATVPWWCWITWHFFKSPKKEDVLCKSFFREFTEVQIKNMYWATFSSLRTTKQRHNFVFYVQLFKCSVTILCHIFCLYIPVRICFSLNLWCFHVSEFISTTKAEHFPRIAGSVLMSRSSGTGSLGYRSFPAFFQASKLQSAHLVLLSVFTGTTYWT